MSRGFVCIITNVASKWGKTPVNYTQLAAMHTTYAEKGLRILGFPCNQFGKQVRFTTAPRLMKAQAFKDLVCSILFLYHPLEAT